MGMEIQSLTTHWWLLGLAVLACVLTFISPWAFTLQLVLLAGRAPHPGTASDPRLTARR